MSIPPPPIVRHRVQILCYLSLLLYHCCSRGCCQFDCKTYCRNPFHQSLGLTAIDAGSGSFVDITFPPQHTVHVVPYKTPYLGHGSTRGCCCCLPSSSSGNPQQSFHSAVATTDTVCSTGSLGISLSLVYVVQWVCRYSRKYVGNAAVGALLICMKETL